MTAQQALRAIDFPTIVLLFSMTVIVAHLHLGGFFEWVADLTVLRLNAQQLLAAVVFTSGVLSAFLVNDVVCLALTPLLLHRTRPADHVERGGSANGDSPRIAGNVQADTSALSFDRLLPG